MKILAIDIETSPNLADVWGLWQQNVSLSQLRESSSMICFAAKYIGEPKVYFHSDFHDGHGTMVRAAWDLMTEADVLLHYNGKQFDVPTLNKEILLEGLMPPAPSKDIDLYRVAKKNFRLPSYKLDYFAKVLGLPGKVEHEGHVLWQKCMANDPKAWAQMKKYCIGDTVLLEDIYEKVLPWIAHPHRGLYSGIDSGCPNCESDYILKQGFAYLDTGTYQRYSCGTCGKWFRGTRRIGSVGTKGL